MKALIKWIICFIPLAGFAKDDDISFSGWGETGIKLTQQNIVKGHSEETYFKAKLKADIRLNKNIDAQIELKGDSSDNHISFHEFWVKFDYAKYFNTKAGFIKRPISFEQSLSRTDLLTFNRSNAQKQMSNMGYGARSTGIQGYYNFNEKRPEFPYSYAVNLSKGNSNNDSINLMFRRHYENIMYSTYAQLIYRKAFGDLKITTFGAGADVIYQSNHLLVGTSMYLLEDPVAGLQNVEQNLIIIRDGLDVEPFDESIIALATNFFTSYKINNDGELFKTIEPIFLSSIFVNNIDQSQNYELQTAFGVNSYFEKNIRLRFQANLLFTNNDASDSTGLNGSNLELGLQVKF